MVLLDDAALPVPQRLAIAHSPPSVRSAMQALLHLDAHFARLVSGTHEAMLGQIRLAWWREELAKPAGERARGNFELDAVGVAWTGEEAALVALVDGWEHLLGEAPLPEESIERFAGGRATAFAGLARLVDAHGCIDMAGAAARRWALVDLAFKVGDPLERERCRALFEARRSPRARLPRALRGLALLDGLAHRSMARDEPLMAGRMGALAALRLGLLGR